MNETMFYLRQAELEKAKTHLRCVMLLTTQEDANAEANRLYSDFIGKFTKAIEKSLI